MRISLLDLVPSGEQGPGTSSSPKQTFAKLLCTFSKHRSWCEQLHALQCVHTYTTVVAHNLSSSGSGVPDHIEYAQHMHMIWMCVGMCQIITLHTDMGTMLSAHSCLSPLQTSTEHVEEAGTLLHTAGVIMIFGLFANIQADHQWRQTHR